MGRIDEQCNKAMSPKTNEILKKGKGMAAPMKAGARAAISSG